MKLMQCITFTPFLALKEIGDCLRPYLFEKLFDPMYYKNQINLKIKNHVIFFLQMHGYLTAILEYFNLHNVFVSNKLGVL